MKEFLAQHVIEYGLLIGAIIGGVAAMRVSKEKVISKLASFFVGVPVAVLISPLLCNMLNVTQETSRTGIAVIVGYGGLSLLDKVLMVLYKKLDNNGNI